MGCDEDSKEIVDMMHRAARGVPPPKGAEIMVETPQPGIYPGVPFDEYLAWDLPSYSAIKGMALGQTAAHYLYDRAHPQEESEAMSIGDAVHCAVLTPDVFRGRFKPLPDKSPTGAKFIRSGKHWDALQADNPGVEWLKRATYDRALAAAAAIAATPEAMALLDGAEKELSFVRAEPMSGLLYKGRMDAYKDATGIADLKWTEIRVLGRWGFQAYGAGLHVQVGMYCDAMAGLRPERWGRTNPCPFSFIVVDDALVVSVWDGHASSDPSGESYDPVGFLNLGRQAYACQLQHLAYCQLHNEYPAHSNVDRHTLAIPKYAMQEI